MLPTDAGAIGYSDVAILALAFDVLSKREQ